jgi:hypothetical protein
MRSNIVYHFNGRGRGSLNENCSESLAGGSELESAFAPAAPGSEAYPAAAKATVMKSMRVKDIVITNST